MGDIRETKLALEHFSQSIMLEQDRFPIELEVQHCLLSAQETTDLAKITTVYSHPEALHQCRKWLQLHLPSVKLQEESSTASSAEKASLNSTTAAIASRFCISLFPTLHCLAEGIQDCKENYTLFLSIQRKA